MCQCFFINFCSYTKCISCKVNYIFDFLNRSYPVALEYALLIILIAVFYLDLYFKLFCPDDENQVGIQ